MRDPKLAPERSSTALPLIFYGRIIHSTSRTEVTILSKASLGINKDGKIAFVETAHVSPAEAAKRHHGFGNASIIHLKPLQFLFPGLIDTHMHAPQYPNISLGMEGDLKEWCEGWTDPIEASYSDTSKAGRVYPAMVSNLLTNGTTTVAYNSSIHPDATNVLAEICKEKGQRAIIGKLCIETGATHGNMEKSVEQSLKDEQKVVEHILNKVDPKGELVLPCIQPRAGSYVSESLMSGLGKLCHNATDEKSGLRIQAHMCETPLEVSNMHALHPGYQSYADMYNHHGLFGPRTILAHCIHLTDRDIDVMAERGVGVAHNANSNTCLRDGWCRVRRLLERGVKVGLGTDCSAGYSISILNAIRQASNVSRHLAISTGDEKWVLKFEELVYLATMGGAEVCSLSDRVGNFETGKEFDALVVDVGLDDNINVQGWEHDEEAMLKKWVFMGDDRSIRKVFVAGKLVAGKDTEAQKSGAMWMAS
ncbi:putative guanine deaminase [Neohortaea acidophila]|uniref:Putative guanine deaminase n=1 Tax=Neohortaea acidophila TaxID=245834 RepID=A0A6A6PZW0_9PEZI|nr:putative guanine deaminase [Neohortaea acidophila]KAF2485565.1 putative guanine deaminase [Neohortaea acidophila]